MRGRQWARALQRRRGRTPGEERHKDFRAGETGLGVAAVGAAGHPPGAKRARHLQREGWVQL